MATEKRSKAPKFRDSEKKILLDNVERHYKLISGKFADTVTLKKKASCWVEITEKVNAQNVNFKRTVDQVKKKWEDMKGIARKKANAERATVGKTGNLPNADEDDSLTEEERRIVGLIGADYTYGIPGGIDTDDPPGADVDGSKDDGGCSDKVG